MPRKKRTKSKLPKFEMGDIHCRAVARADKNGRLYWRGTRYAARTEEHVKIGRATEEEAREIVAALILGTPESMADAPEVSVSRLLSMWASAVGEREDLAESTAARYQRNAVVLNDTTIAVASVSSLTSKRLAAQAARRRAAQAPQRAAHDGRGVRGADRSGRCGGQGDRRVRPGVRAALRAADSGGVWVEAGRGGVMLNYFIMSPQTIRDALRAGVMRPPTDEDRHHCPDVVAMWGPYPIIESTPIQIDSMEFSAEPFRVTGLGGEE